MNASHYENYIVEIMRVENFTLLRALEFDFNKNGIDTTSVLSMCDYLEKMLENLDKVNYYMLVYTEQVPDVKLKETKKSS
tara:strand:+ start:3096 stop:3335 length:240 start_codon:yes stop_codon:yes gene_type:complete